MERSFFTVAEYAERLGVPNDKVLFFIATEQLAAVNVAKDPNGRKRYRISADEIKRFETARATIQTPDTAPAPRRRRRKDTELEQFV